MTCKHCGGESTRKNRHGNPSSTCTKCSNKQTNGWKARNPKALMVQCARIRAKRAGVPCTITFRDFEIPYRCPILGIALRKGTRHDHDASPSLDRIVPELGYVKGNIVVISHRANRIKQDATADELIRLANWLRATVSQAEKDLALHSRARRAGPRRIADVQARGRWETVSGHR